MTVDTLSSFQSEISTMNKRTIAWEAGTGFHLRASLKPSHTSKQYDTRGLKSLLLPSIRRREMEMEFPLGNGKPMELSPGSVRLFMRHVLLILDCCHVERSWQGRGESRFRCGERRLINAADKLIAVTAYPHNSRDFWCDHMTTDIKTVAEWIKPSGSMLGDQGIAKIHSSWCEGKIPAWLYSQLI